MIDYDVAADLPALVKRSDLIIRGTIESAEHDLLVGESPKSDVARVTTGGESAVLYSSSSGAVPPDSFAISLFALRGEAEFEPAAIRGLEFVAFLRDQGLDGFVVDIQGLVVACLETDDSAKPILEPLPAEASNMAIADLEKAVRTLGAPD